MCCVMPLTFRSRSRIECYCVFSILSILIPFNPLYLSFANILKLYQIILYLQIDIYNGLISSISTYMVLYIFESVSASFICGQLVCNVTQL